MVKTIINLTEMHVREELYAIQDIYPESAEIMQLNNPDFLRKLIIFILLRIPNRYIVIDVDDESSINPKSLHIPYQTAEKIAIEDLIYKGINYLSEETSRKIGAGYINSVQNCYISGLT
jgi:hypothetical protein